MLIFPVYLLKKVCTLSKHAVTEFTVISFVQHTLAFISSLFLDRMVAQSRNFYENNMISGSYYQIQPKVVLKVVHVYDYQNKVTQKNITIMKK